MLCYSKLEVGLSFVLFNDAWSQKGHSVTVEEWEQP